MHIVYGIMSPSFKVQSKEQSIRLYLQLMDNDRSITLLLYPAYMRLATVCVRACMCACVRACVLSCRH